MTTGVCDWQWVDIPINLAAWKGKLQKCPLTSLVSGNPHVKADRAVQKPASITSGYWREEENC
jgi:hypothetical protein